jgi:hypothetical protein
MVSSSAYERLCRRKNITKINTGCIVCLPAIMDGTYKDTISHPKMLVKNHICGIKKDITFII